MATRIPSITLNMNNPYSVKTHRECVPIWKKVNPTFKDLEHRPPFELAYACYLNLINHIKKSSPCTNCKKPLEGTGLYFPLEEHHIMPLPCCEKCCTFDIKNGTREMRNLIYVNKYQRSIKFYTWKMMVCANLVLPMYNKMMKEEEEAELVQKTKAFQMIECFEKESSQENILYQETNIIQDNKVEDTKSMGGEEEIIIKNNNNEQNNYYFGNINEYNTDLYNLIEIDENKKDNKNVFMIFISFIATILASTLYYVFNK